jgi:hypothetical protein
LQEVFLRERKKYDKGTFCQFRQKGMERLLYRNVQKLLDKIIEQVWGWGFCSFLSESHEDGVFNKIVKKFLT